MPLLFRPDIIIENGVEYIAERVRIEDLPAWKKERGLVAVGCLPGHWPPAIIFNRAAPGPGKEPIDGEL